MVLVWADTHSLSSRRLMRMQLSATYMCRDHDLEGMTDGFDAPTAYGQIEGYEDASMGWSR